MSPRAAWRLEAEGFTSVHDYVAGKNDWLAADLPYEGEADLVGRHTRHDVPTIAPGDRVGEALARLDAYGFGPVLVVNQAGVLLGTARRAALEAIGEGAPVDKAVSLGVSTVRPSEQVGDLVHRMGHAGVTRLPVSRSDGTLVGLFFARDVT
jgi:CBS domain-containing protein